MNLSLVQWEKLVMESYYCQRVFVKDAEEKFELLLSGEEGEEEEEEEGTGEEMKGLRGEEEIVAASEERP
jgi:hypothetical protein